MEERDIDRGDKARISYKTEIESFMPLEPILPSNRHIYLEREIDEEDLKERYKKAYEGIKL